VKAAVERARGGDGATLISAKVARFTSHSSDDDQRRYRPQAELEALLRIRGIERVAIGGISMGGFGALDLARGAGRYPLGDAKGRDNQVVVEHHAGLPC